jgi:hypothetical protein
VVVRTLLAWTVPLLARALVLVPALGPLTSGGTAAEDITAAAAALPIQLPTFSNKVIGAPFSHRAPSFTASGTVVDLDGNGRDEIIQPFANYPPDNPNRAEPVKILRADAATFAFSEATASFVSAPVPALVHPRVFGHGDFNGDGKRDVFLGGHGYDAMPFAGEENWLLLSKASSKKLNAQVAPPGSPLFTHAIASGDINGDGIDDIYVGVLCCSIGQGPYFLLGRQGGMPVVSNGRLAPTVAQRTLKYTAAALVDVDRRHRKDLVLGSDGGHDSVVYLNDGNGYYNRSEPDIILPPGLFGRNNTIVLDIQAADLDTDGRPDLILSQTKLYPFYQGYGLQVLMNRNAQFVDETAGRLQDGSGVGQTGAWKSRIYTADFYGDGLIDLVVHGGCPTSMDTFVIWINDGSGSFTPQTRALFDGTDSRQDCNFLYPTDLDRDGLTDLVRIIGTSPTTDEAWSYLNRGLGTTASSGPFPEIVRQPVAAKVKAGSALVLSAAARGQRPMRFQWLKDGQPIPGATAPVYRVAKAASLNAGKYRVRITNAAGAILSQTVSVVVR